MVDTKSEMEMKDPEPPSLNEVEYVQVKWWHVDVQMLPVKITLFFAGMSKSAFIPYLSIFLVSVGFSLKETGVIIAVGKAGMIFGSLFWTFLADKTGARRCVIFIMMLIYLISNTSLPFMSAWVGPSELNVCPVINSTRQNRTSSSQNTSLRASGVLSWPSIFALMNALQFTVGFTNQGVPFLNEGAIYKVKQSVRGANMGRQFIFVNIGFGIGTTLSGKVLDAFPQLGVSCYATVFIFFAALFLVAIVSMQVVYKDRKPNGESVVAQNSLNYRQELFEALKDVDLLIHYLTVLVVGFVYQVYLAYIFLFLHSLKAPNILIGLTIACGSMSGFFVSFFCSKSIPHLHGVWNSYIVAIFIYAVRFFIFAIMINPWIIIPVQLILHGMCLTFCWVLNAEYLQNKENVSQHIRTSLFGIQSSVYQGVGPILGSLFGGFVYQSHGARNLFLSTGGIAVVWAVFLTAVELYKWQINKRKRMSQEDTKLMSQIAEQDSFE